MFTCHDCCSMGGAALFSVFFFTYMLVSLTSFMFHLARVKDFFCLLFWVAAVRTWTGCIHATDSLLPSESTSSRKQMQIHMEGSLRGVHGPSSFGSCTNRWVGGGIGFLPVFGWPQRLTGCPPQITKLQQLNSTKRETDRRRTDEEGKGMICKSGVKKKTFRKDLMK